MNEESLFHLALQQPEAARAAFLDQACVNQPQLRARLEKLLQAHAAPVGLFDKPAVEVGSSDEDADSPPLSEGPGTRIGPYKLLQQIGEGGMGIVYLAEQKQPVRRKVALKIIKPGMDTRQVIAKSGEPLQLTEDERISVAFFPAEASGTTFDAYLTQRKEDGTLQVIGKDGKGMPLGKYRVSLEHFKQEKDLFKGAYSGSKSPIIREVKNGSDEIVIDLDNPTS
jgi:serine/threonine protein kinase